MVHGENNDLALSSMSMARVTKPTTCDACWCLGSADASESPLSLGLVVSLTV